jgi:hypothetical protein
MGLMDKVKAAAEKAAAEAKKGTAQVKGKLEDAQLRRKADDAAKRLGYLIFKERAQGEPAGDEADRLVQEIGTLEAQIVAEAETAEESPPAAPAEAAEPSPSPDAEPPSGDFKLD